MFISNTFEVSNFFTSSLPTLTKSNRISKIIHYMETLSYQTMKAYVNIDRDINLRDLRQRITLGTLTEIVFENCSIFFNPNKGMKPQDGSTIVPEAIMFPNGTVFCVFDIITYNNSLDRRITGIFREVFVNKFGEIMIRIEEADGKITGFFSEQQIVFNYSALERTMQRVSM